MTGKTIISNTVIGALAHILDKQYSRPEIASLFMRSGATGPDPYSSNKKQMITDWLAETNKNHDEPISVLDGILEDFFDGIVSGKSPETLDADREMIRKRLANSGMQYSNGARRQLS